MAVDESATMTDSEQSPRGRRRGREDDGGPVTTNGSGSPVEEMSPTSGVPKKRRRSRKGQAEKKFECKHEGCGKSYSRAEHLYRHQLNHTPKHIYRCDYPDCYRSFVRQDLCIRHRERHTTHGSQLHRRDTFAQTASSNSPIAAAPLTRDDSMVPATTPANAISPAEITSSPELRMRPSTSLHSPIASKADSNYHSSNLSSGPTGYAASVSSTSLESHYQPPTPQAPFVGPELPLTRSDSNGSYTLSPQQKHPFANFKSSTRHGSFGSIDGQRVQNTPLSSGEYGRYGIPKSMSSTSIRSDSMSSSGTANAAPIYQIPMSSIGSTPYASHQNLRISTLPPPGFSTPSIPRNPTTSFATAITNSLSALDPTSIAPGSQMGESNGMDPMAPYAYPIFGGETYNRSPFAMADDFAAWLFNDQQISQSASIGFTPVTGMMPGYTDAAATQFQGPYYPQDASFQNYYSSIIPPQHPMSVTSILDPIGPPQSIMSEEKRQEILDMIIGRFNETEHAAVRKRKDVLLEGDRDADGHILSLRMMQTYIGSFWYHSHAQLPILHKPTFAADKTPNLLLVAVMAIGASTLDKMHGQPITEAASELANFLAWHVRWEIFMDADFRPPAKLWVFQTLLLVETYEKMYSTRALHERAHIHHDTTLTLMRRGSSLIGRSAFDSPPSMRDATNGSGSTSASDAGDESWTHWIRNEATRRAAFAAFVIDSTHATMFGHSAKMVAHEMRLPLPCDEALWSATSAAEVARVQSSLQSNGIKPTMFLDGLKKTLNCQKVRTNSFGRTIIMAGLLSVSWHMNQRDLQVSSLGVAQALGGQDKWRSSLLRAFDNWKRDFDEALAESAPTEYNSPFRAHFRVDDENIFESRTVLHHLAHMASHVDIVDCQIFAGAGRLLGRSVTPKDYSTAREKMTEKWATKASARDAAFYALKFLAQVLIPTEVFGRPGQGGQSNSEAYSARDDFLLNRPWVLYFAALVVWCYGYALEGHIVPLPPELATPAEQESDMRQYLERVAGVRAPDDLDAITGRNRCLGMLMILKESFSVTRWELLHEAANLLGSCINKLRNTNSAVTPQQGTPMGAGRMGSVGSF